MKNEKMKIGHIHVWDKDNKGDVAIVQAVQNLLHAHLALPLEVEDFPMEILQNLNQVNLQRLNACDLVVIGGGGVYYKYFLPFDTENLARINPPLVIFGVGYIREIGAGELSAEEKASLVALNAQAALASVRDFRTRDLLVEAGVIADHLAVIGDPAIFLPEDRTERIRRDDGRIKIGMNLNYSGWLGFGQYEDLILDSYNQVANYFQQNFGAQVFYLQHHPGEANILRKLDIKDLEVIDLAPAQQKYAYAQLDLVLGMMLHSAVLSFGAETPFVNLGYDIRNKSFGDFIGSPELVIGADELRAGVLVTKTLETFEQRRDYEKKFIQRKQEIWENQRDFLSRIEDLAKTD